MNRIAGLVVAFVGGFVLLFLVQQGLSSARDLGYEPGTLRATITGPHSASLALYTMPDSFVCHDPPTGGGPRPDWVSYCPTTSLWVPSHSLITVTVRQYDQGDAAHNPFFSVVHGTVNGKAELVHGTDFNNKTYTDHWFSSWPNVSGSIGHTFTIQPANNSPTNLFVSIPLPGLPDPSQKGAPQPVSQKILGHTYTAYQAPNIIRFQFRSGPKGEYIWKCYIPCGSGLYGFEEGFGGPMGTTGYMLGTLRVG
jgi:hypothetical protein